MHKKHTAKTETSKTSKRRKTKSGGNQQHPNHNSQNTMNRNPQRQRIILSQKNSIRKNGLRTVEGILYLLRDIARSSLYM